MFTLGEAARQCGVAKGTISKAVRTGKLSASRNEDGSFKIDPAELARYLETNGHRFRSETGSTDQLETREKHADARADTLVAELRAVIADLRADRDCTISDLRADRDHWRAQAEQALRLLPGPQPERRQWRWWRRAE